MQQLRSSSNSFPPARLYPLTVLPEPYQTAFRQGSAHYLPGRFLRAQTDWFVQICLLPFMVMYALPILGLVPALISQAIYQPSSYGRLWQTLTQQNLPELGFTLLLFLVLAVLSAIAPIWPGIWPNRSTVPGIALDCANGKRKATEWCCCPMGWWPLD